mmetsp:Transcript_27374/g.59821  ORF Transcript_27374/g.59821 Transcript_27374/m.59821 type:complete len:275 (-) Transcript_27374:1101-1925(-)
MLLVLAAAAGDARGGGSSATTAGGGVPDSRAFREAICSMGAPSSSTTAPSTPASRKPLRGAPAVVAHPVTSLCANVPASAGAASPSPRISSATLASTPSRRRISMPSFSACLAAATEATHLATRRGAALSAEACMVRRATAAGREPGASTTPSAPAAPAMSARARTSSTAPGNPATISLRAQAASYSAPPPSAAAASSARGGPGQGEARLGARRRGGHASASTTLRRTASRVTPTACISTVVPSTQWHSVNPSHPSMPTASSISSRGGGARGAL